MPPAFVLGSIEGDMQERPPLRPFRLTNQCHLCLLRKAIAFPCVTGNTRTNHVFPSRGSATVSRHHVIEVQIVSIESDSAILTGVLIALENIVTRKFYFLLREAIEKQENDHARHANLP